MVEPFLNGRFDQVHEVLVEIRVSGFLEPGCSSAQGKLQMFVSLEDTLVFCLHGAHHRYLVAVVEGQKWDVHLWC